MGRVLIQPVTFAQLGTGFVALAFRSNRSPEQSRNLRMSRPVANVSRYTLSVTQPANRVNVPLRPLGALLQPVHFVYRSLGA
jgi:hypothetical protein